MILLTSIQRWETPCNSTFDGPLHDATAKDVLARHQLERTIGTPENAALVAAFRREFPEIYRLPPKRARNAGLSLENRWPRL
jgi:hypothetical protein